MLCKQVAQIKYVRVVGRRVLLRFESCVGDCADKSPSSRGCVGISAFEVDKNKGTLCMWTQAHIIFILFIILFFICLQVGANKVSFN